MEGAEFTIYLVSNLSKVKDSTLKPGNGSEFTPEDFIGYDFTDEEVAVTYEDGKEIEVPVLVTDKRICQERGTSIWTVCGCRDQNTGKSETSPSVFGNCKRRQQRSAGMESL